MNNDLEQFSEERLSEIILDAYDADLSNDEIEALARIALAAKQLKPMAKPDRAEIAGLSEDGWCGNFMAPDYKEVDEGNEGWLYTIPQLSSIHSDPNKN